MDIDFQTESLAWLRSVRGDEFIDELADSIHFDGRERAFECLIHSTMSAAEFEAYQAAIKYISRASLVAAQLREDVL